MAHNPFLSMGEPVAPVSTDALNPFMIAETEQEIHCTDNPFATSNPFSDFSSTYEPPAGDTVPMDIFGNLDAVGAEAKQYNEFPCDTNGPVDCFANPLPEVGNKIIKPTELDLSSTNVHMNSLYSSEEELQKPQRPPPPPVRPLPLPTETQNLILSVTGQMDFTSSHLLDRIPPTRTPSPVSMRDIHSPSPTPEPDILFDEELPHDENVFSNTLQNETGITGTAGTIGTTGSSEAFDINQNKPSRPSRPPPARPLPPAARPPPPRPAHPAFVPQPPQSMHDDINLFEAPVPSTVKPTKEAILSLYATPKKEEKQIDFLSDDILDEVPQTEQNAPQLSQPSPGIGPEPADDSFSNFNLETAVIAAEDVSTAAADDAAMDCSGPTAITETTSVTQAESTQPLPFLGLQPISETSPFADLTNETGFQDQNNCALNNPFEDGPVQSVMTSQTSTTHLPRTPETALAMETTGGWGSAYDTMAQDSMFPESEDAFDAFSAKFDSTFSSDTKTINTCAWGESAGAGSGRGAGGAGDAGGSKGAADGGAEAADGGGGFEADTFDPFLSMGAPPPPAATPRLRSQGSADSNDDTFSLFIRPKESEAAEETVPTLAPPPPPPPRPHALPDSPRPNPFDSSRPAPGFGTSPDRADHQQPHAPTTPPTPPTPPTPLFDDDVSVPLEEFPRTKYSGPGWEMQLRQPNKKKITGQRFWKKVFVRLTYQGDNPVVQLLNSAADKEPFQELPLQACYSVSEVGAQQFDQFGKIFTVKLQYVFYKERPGVRPGQVTKAERITSKLSQFAAYAMQGDYAGVKEFGSDLRKLGLPVEHAPQVSQLFKLGSLCYEDVRQLSCCVEEALFRLPAHRDRALTYKMEEVQITAVDELYVDQDAEGSVLKQIARVRLFFLGFLSGMPDVEVGVNDLRRQGREVVGRHDIIPVVTEEWIRGEEHEFHACVQPQYFHDTQVIKFKPPDACYIELMRFRVRPPKNRELPLQLKAVWCVTGNKVELRADALVPGFASRKLGQVPCEDVSIRFPIPECWIYLFRVEKHFRYGSVKSAHRRTGKIKGIERFLGAVDTLQESLIEVTSGQAKYEHQHRAIVWRMPRLPKEGQGAYTTHNLVCRMALTSYDQVPAQLAQWAHVEFTMPATQVSHMTVRSVSLQEHDADPPEKYVRYLARHEYRVGIERTTGQAPAAYAAAAAAPATSPRADAPATSPHDDAPAAPTLAPVPGPPSSDSDSD